MTFLQWDEFEGHPLQHLAIRKHFIFRVCRPLRQDDANAMV